MSYDLVIQFGRVQNGRYDVHLKTGNGEVNSIFTPPFEGARLDQILQALRRVEYDALDERAVQPRDIGEQLAQALFEGPARDLYLGIPALRTGEGIRILIKLDPYDSEGFPLLSRLPWELLTDLQRRDYLCNRKGGGIVRQLMLPHGAEDMGTFPSPLRILVVTASPEGQPTLEVAGELAKLEQAIDDKSSILLTPIEHATPSKVAQALREAKDRGTPFHALHFIGHGGMNPNTGKGYLAFENEQGKLEPTEAHFFTQLLARHKSLRMIFLNACHTGDPGVGHPFESVAGELVAHGFPFVLAMNNRITDKAATQFSTEFYRTLTDGSIEDAVIAGRQAILEKRVHGLEWSIPVLFSRAGTVRVISEQDWPFIRKLWTALACLLLYLSLAIYGQTQQYQLELPSISKESYPASIYGLGLCLPLFFVVLWLTRYHARNHANMPWYGRLPYLWNVRWNFSKKESRKAQGCIFFCLLVLPMAAQVHFFSKMTHGEVSLLEMVTIDGVEEKRITPIAVRGCHFLRYIPPGKAFKNKREHRFFYGDGNPDKAVDIFPFWEPWGFLILELWLAYSYFKTMRILFGKPPT